MEFPVPVPPVRRFISAADEVSARSGVSVRVSPGPGHYVWAAVRTLGSDVAAVCSGAIAQTEAGPGLGRLYQDVLTAVLQLRRNDTEAVFCDDENAATGLRRHGLDVTGQYPPAPAIVAMDEAIRARRESLYTTLDVATDASRGHFSAWVGHGWVLDFGAFVPPILGHQAIERGSVLEGELRAIRLALTAARSTYAGTMDGRCAVSVRSDNQAAVRMLAKPGFEPSSMNSRCAVEVERILGLVRHASVDFRWVKGHAGDPLNTTADRLAVLSRRTREANLTLKEANTLYDAVRADARSALRCSGVALAA